MAPQFLPIPVVGADLSVPLVTGGHARYVNLDYAASPPCLRAVADTIDRLLPWYSSVHRGAGFASTVTTEIYAAARRGLARFVGAPANHSVVFTRNTTDALNLLASALPDDTTVVTFASEHHANLLPWRRGARIAVDAAQLAPHRAIDMAALGADYVALSGHKLYAPFGAGALIGRADWLDAARPYLAGGGAVRDVTVDDTDWADGPARHEAGTPNVIGAAALAAACQTLAAQGMARVAAHEATLLARLIDGLRALPGVAILSLWGGAAKRIGVVSFVVAGWHPGALAAALSAEYGIGVRDGAFCAHPLVTTMLGSRVPGAVRASFGVGTEREDIDRFLAALRELVTHGARWQYRVDAGRYVPDADPRVRPEVHRELTKLLGGVVVEGAPCAARASTLA